MSMFDVRGIMEPEARHTIIHRIDPRTKIFLLIAYSFLAISIDNEYTLLLLFILPLIAYPIARFSMGKYKIAAIFIVIGLWGVILSQALFYQQWPRTVIVTVIPASFPLLGSLTGGVYIYEEGFFFGLVQGLRFSAMIALGFLVLWTTDPRKMLTGMIKLRIPYTLAFMLMTAMRFLPILISEVVTVINIQRLRGFNPTRSWKVRKAIMNTLTPVLANSVRRATTLSTSVESRAFRTNPTRTQFKDLKYTLYDWTIIATALTTAVSIVIIKVLFGLYVLNIYYATELREIYEFAATYL